MSAQNKNLITLDINNMFTISNYARRFNIPRKSIYDWLKNNDKRISVITIDGVKFISPR